MMRRHSISVAIGGILVLLLAGGAGVPGLWAAEKGALQQAVPAPPPAAPAGGSGGALEKPLPVPASLPPVPTYEYSAAGKPDPFKPFMETEPAPKPKEENLGKKRSVPGASISPLQRLELSQFRLLGIAGDENSRAAIVADGTSKKFYPLFVGTYIGLNGGRVAAILPDRVVVEERTETRDKRTKRVQVKKIPMLLHKEQEEGKP
jgi:Tfp pilus assembly protein PilP